MMDKEYWKLKKREQRAKKALLSGKKEVVEPDKNNLGMDVGRGGDLVERFESVESSILSSPTPVAEQLGKPPVDPSMAVGEPFPERKLSPSDQKKSEERPGWYIFGEVERETNCWRCGKKYSTRLELSKFCSSKCKTEYLDSASHLRK